MITVALALALIGQQNCPGGVCPIQRPTTLDPAYAAVVVRIENHQVGSTAYGSGVILTETGLVLTCRHIFEGGTGSLIVRRSDGRGWRARFLATDPNADLGAIQIGDVGTIPHVRYANTQADRAVIVGFPGSGLAATARMGKYEQTANVFYGVNSPHGVSGGPVFRPGTLDLVGVQWGADGRSSAVTSIDVVRAFLSSPTCFRFFRRQPKQINVNVSGTAPVAVPPVTVTPDPAPVLTQPIPNPGIAEGPTPAPVPVVTGPVGPTGPQGPVGPAGPAATLSVADLPAIEINALNPDGTAQIDATTGQPVRKLYRVTTTTDPVTGKAVPAWKISIGTSVPLSPVSPTK